MADVEIDLENTNPNELMGLGLRAFAIGDFTNAAAAFGRASEILAQEYGDHHDSLGEVFVNYARALLELSREEAEPLGDMIPQGDSDSESEEGDEDGEGEGEGEGEGDGEGEEGEGDSGPTETENDKTDENKSIEKKDKKEDENEGATQNGGSKLEKGKENEPNKGDDDAKSEDEKNEVVAEDCSDLQLAWEVLEVAKTIFIRRGEVGKTMLAETWMLLGEIAMESERFSDGINDMKIGIEIQKSVAEATSRKLAESYYKLGTALVTNSNIEEAIINFELSIDTLKKRIQMLKDMLENAEEETSEMRNTESDDRGATGGSDATPKPEKDEKTKGIKKSKIEEEIKEITSLIPEIEEKVNDTKSIKTDMAAKLIMQMESDASKVKEGDAGSSKTAKDISHLVKRKRKDDDEPADTTSVNPTKKLSP